MDRVGPERDADGDSELVTSSECVSPMDRVEGSVALGELEIDSESRTVRVLVWDLEFGRDWDCDVGSV